jgi:8-oxo-dGTP diphosphatase
MKAGIMGAKQQGADATDGRWLVIPRTLCFVIHDGAVLLMRRGPHKRVFPNQYNGLGGHIERGEDPSEGARREIEEESGLQVRDLRLRGVHHIDAGAGTGILLFTFTAVSDSREVIAESEEGTLHWVPFDQIHELDLVEDLPQVLDRVLVMPDDAPPYFVHVSYDEDDQISMRFAVL